MKITIIKSTLISLFFCAFSIQAMMIDDAADPDKGKTLAVQVPPKDIPVQVISEPEQVVQNSSSEVVGTSDQQGDVDQAKTDGSAQDASAASVGSASSSGQEISYGLSGQASSSSVSQVRVDKESYDKYQQSTEVAPVVHEEFADTAASESTSAEDDAALAGYGIAAAAGAAAIAGLGYLGYKSYNRKKTKDLSDLGSQKKELQSKIDNPATTESERKKYQAQMQELDSRIQAAEGKTAKDDLKKNPALAKVLADEQKAQDDKAKLDAEKQKLSDEKAQLEADRKTLEDKVKNGGTLTPEEKDKLEKTNAALDDNEKKATENKKQQDVMDKHLADLTEQKKTAQDDQKKNPALEKALADEQKAQDDKAALDREKQRLSDEKTQLEATKKTLEDKGDTLTAEEKDKLAKTNAALSDNEKENANNELQQDMMDKHLADLTEQKKAAAETTAPPKTVEQLAKEKVALENKKRVLEEQSKKRTLLPNEKAELESVKKQLATNASAQKTAALKSSSSRLDQLRGAARERLAAASASVSSKAAAVKAVPDKITGATQSAAQKLRSYVPGAKPAPAKPAAPAGTHAQFGQSAKPQPKPQTYKPPAYAR